MTGSLRRSISSIILLVMAFVPVACIQAGEADINTMLASIEKRLADPNAKQEAIMDGEDRALLCKYCHGSDGNSIKPDVPNLAGQNARYLLEQINKFATRVREDFVMSELAAGFSTEDKINVAIFYSTQTVKPGAADKEQAARGQAIYHSACSSCHGMKGLGSQEMARVAGQQAGYTEKVMKDFRNNANDSASKQKSSRHSTIMEAASKDLTDEQIGALAAYMAQMQ